MRVTDVVCVWCHLDLTELDRVWIGPGSSSVCPNGLQLHVPAQLRSE